MSIATLRGLQFDASFRPSPKQRNRCPCAPPKIEILNPRSPVSRTPTKISNLFIFPIRICKKCSWATNRKCWICCQCWPWCINVFLHRNYHRKAVVTENDFMFAELESFFSSPRAFLETYENDVFYSFNYRSFCCDLLNLSYIWS